jgi:hypothetical protein
MWEKASSAKKKHPLVRRILNPILVHVIPWHGLNLIAALWCKVSIINLREQSF